MNVELDTTPVAGNSKNHSGGAMWGAAISDIGNALANMGNSAANIVSAANNTSKTTTKNEFLRQDVTYNVNNKSMMLTAAILGGVAIIVVLVIRLTKD